MRENELAALLNLHPVAEERTPFAILHIIFFLLP